MLVDMHIHESTFSKDSNNNLWQIVEAAKHKGLDAVCITDHDSMGLRETAEKYSKEICMPIFVGVEYYSIQGDILAFGIDKLPSARMDAQQFINYVKSFNGVCFSAHPFRDNDRGLKEHLKYVKGLDGIEALNGNSTLNENKKAFEYCKTLGLQAIGASDSHNPDTIGKYATKLPQWASSMDEFINIIKLRQCKLAIYENGKYRVIEKY